VFSVYVAHIITGTLGVVAMRCFNILMIVSVCLCLSALSASASYEYPTKVLYLRDLGTKYTGETVSLTAEIITVAGDECKSCRVWFYVEGPYWEGDHWVGYTPYSDYAESGLYTLEWKIAPGMSTGNYAYYAQVLDSDGNAMSQLSDGYSFRIIEENMRARVIGLWPIDDTPAGANVDFLAQIENTGDTPLDYNCQVKFYVTASSDSGTQKYAAGSRDCVTDDFAGTIDVLGAGGTRWYKLPWTLPYVSGKYAYYATVEYNGREINEIPPTFSFHVIEPRKASVISLLPVSDARTGNSVTLGTVVENSADIVLADGCKIAYYVSGPSKGGLKLSGFVGYTDCAQTESSGLQALSYKEQRDYSLKWTPPLAGEYSYKAVVKYLETEISPWSAEQAFRVGDDVVQEYPEPEPSDAEDTYVQETLPEELPDAAEMTTTTSEALTETTTIPENDSAQAPKAVGNVTEVGPDNPFTGFISIIAIAVASMYIIYKASMNLKTKKKKQERQT